MSPEQQFSMMTHRQTHSNGDENNNSNTVLAGNEEPLALTVSAASFLDSVPEMVRSDYALQLVVGVTLSQRRKSC